MKNWVFRITSILCMIFLIAISSSDALAHSLKSPIYLLFVKRTGRDDRQSGKEAFHLQKRLEIEGVYPDDHDDSILVLSPLAEAHLATAKSTDNEIGNVNSIRFKFSSYEIARQKYAVLVESPTGLVLLAKAGLKPRTLVDIRILPSTPELLKLQEGEEISADLVDDAVKFKHADAEAQLKEQLQQIEDRVRKVEEKSVSYWKRIQQKFNPLSYDKKLTEIQEKLSKLKPDDPEVDALELKKEALEQLEDDVWEGKFKEKRASYWKRMNRKFFPISADKKLHKIDLKLSKLKPNDSKVENLAKKEALNEVIRLDWMRKVEASKASYWKRMRRGLSPWELDEELKKVERDLIKRQIRHRKTEKLETKKAALEELIQEVANKKPQGTLLTSDYLKLPCGSDHAGTGDFFCDLSMKEVLPNPADLVLPDQDRVENGQLQSEVTSHPTERRPPRPLPGLPSDQSLDRLHIVKLNYNDARVPHEFAALGDLVQVGNLIWSGTSTQVLSHADAEKFCSNFGMGSKLPSMKDFELLREGLGFSKIYNPNRIPGIKDQKLWSTDVSKSGSPFFFWGYHGTFEDVNRNINLKVMCVIEVIK